MHLIFSLPSRSTRPVTHSEQTDFPVAGYRARRWNRFERDLYEWMNRPEGQFVCWLASRKIEAQAVAGVEAETES